MKRIAAIVLALMLILSLVACGQEENTAAVDDSGDAVIATEADDVIIGDNRGSSGEGEDQDSIIDATVSSDDGVFDNPQAVTGGGSDATDTATEAPAGEATEAPTESEESNDQGDSAPAPADTPIVPEGEKETESDDTAEEKDWLDSFMSSYGKIYLIISLVILLVLAAVIVYLLKTRKASASAQNPVQIGAPSAPGAIPPANGGVYSALPTKPQVRYEPLPGDTNLPDTVYEQSDDSAIKAVRVHHIGKRKNQEDSFGVSDLTNKSLCRTKGAMAVVADGMGGLAGGENVSSLAVLTMLQGFSDMQYGSTGEVELNRLLDNTVDNVNQYLESTVGLKKSGSTMMAVIVHNDMLSWISVGDSRTALYRNGKLTDLNHRHVYGADLDEMARKNLISPAQAMSHPDRDKLTSYLGMGKLKHVDRSARPMPLMKGDRIILMSDGVFNTLTDPEIEQILGLPIDVVGATLEDSVLKKDNPHQDNFTAVILEI